MEDHGVHRPGLSFGRLIVLIFFVLLMLAIGVLGSTCQDRSSERLADSRDYRPFEELYAQGIDRYMGVYTPMLSEEKAGVFTHTFGSGEGPLCLDGSPYRVATMDNHSADLLIFLQGGGMCWSELCKSSRTAREGFDQVGILDLASEENPFHGFNLVHLNYCDGGLFASDRDSDVDGDGDDDRFQRGLHNLSAGLDLALSLFPAPRRVVLMGNSAGGMATTFALPLVRLQYPDQPILVVNDSGVGIGRPGDTNLLNSWIDDWNIAAFFPLSCPHCRSLEAHLTEYNIWLLQQDPHVHQGMLSYTLDNVLSDNFLKIERETYQNVLLREMRKLEASHPERSRHWIKQGIGHCFLHRELEVSAESVRLVDWLDAMLEGDESWDSVVESSPSKAQP